MSATHDHNRRAWDALVAQRQKFTTPAEDDDFARPLRALDSQGWFGESVAGKRVLCLASGGGRQGPLFAAAGAIVTVVDISPAMLALDREVAAERGLALTAIEASMDDLAALPSASFDVVSHPVSTCYVPDIWPVFREVARVTAPAGLYVSQHKQPASLQGSIHPGGAGYELLEPYYRQGPLPSVLGSPHREPGTLEFLHRLEEIVGGMCRAGFVIEELMEPKHASAEAAPGSFRHRSIWLPPYVRIKARRTSAAAPGATSARLWTP